jgi:hypothetical protein
MQQERYKIKPEAPILERGMLVDSKRFWNPVGIQQYKENRA